MKLTLKASVRPGRRPMVVQNSADKVIRFLQAIQMLCP